VTLHQQWPFVTNRNTEEKDKGNENSVKELPARLGIGRIEYRLVVDSSLHYEDVGARPTASTGGASSDG
jgi:hypothetical protein